MLVTNFCCDLWFLLLLVSAKSKTALTFASKSSISYQMKELLPSIHHNKVNLFD